MYRLITERCRILKSWQNIRNCIYENSFLGLFFHQTCNLLQNLKRIIKKTFLTLNARSKSSISTFKKVHGIKHKGWQRHEFSRFHVTQRS